MSRWFLSIFLFDCDICGKPARWSQSAMDTPGDDNRRENLCEDCLASLKPEARQLAK